MVQEGCPAIHCESDKYAGQRRYASALGVLHKTHRRSYAFIYVQCDISARGQYFMTKAITACVT